MVRDASMQKERATKSFRLWTRQIIASRWTVLNNSARWIIFSDTNNLQPNEPKFLKFYASNVSLFF